MSAILLLLWNPRREECSRELRSGGRFAHLLPPQRPGAEGIELARVMLAAMGVTEDRLRGNAGPN
jgi:hypothetical protein